MRGTKRNLWIAMLWLAAVPVAAQSWNSRSVGTTEPLNASWFVDADRGWVVGNGGTLRVTQDGGDSWNPIQLTNDDLQDVAFRGDTVGLVVGDSGRIFRTTDGMTWNAAPSGTDVNLGTVAFGSAGLAYAAGRDGTILRSSNDGQSWQLVETGITRYRDATAVGERAWIVGEVGAIRATDDGGLTWFDQDGGTGSDLKGVSFADRDRGWIAGQNDTMIHTSDGGANWAPRDLGINVGLDSVFFGNATLGWAIGDNGTIFATVDGGLQWTPETSNTTQPLSHVFFLNAFQGWTTGDSGTLLERSQIPVSLAVGAVEIAWPLSAGATSYDVVRGSLDALRSTGGDYASASSFCLADDAAGPPVSHGAAPEPGSGVWFLIRPGFATGNGSYDSGQFSQSGSRDLGLALSGSDCF